jgi:hypothetical protein
MSSRSPLFRIIVRWSLRLSKISKRHLLNPKVVAQTGL